MYKILLLLLAGVQCFISQSLAVGKLLYTACACAGL